MLTGPEEQYTGEKPMDPITADVYVGANSDTTRELDEDDGHSTAYIKGELARTKITLKSDGKAAVLTIEPTVGHYKGMLTARTWNLRFHLPEGMPARKVHIDANGAYSLLRRHL